MGIPNRAVIPPDFRRDLGRCHPAWQRAPDQHELPLSRHVPLTIAMPKAQKIFFQAYGMRRLECAKLNVPDGRPGGGGWRHDRI